MNYLLDVNALVAWGWADHTEHLRVTRWIAAATRSSDTKLVTSAIPQLGFVRVSVQRAGGLVTVAEAGETLEGMLAALGKKHLFLADDQPSSIWPSWCRGHSHTTDAHLVRLAESHGLKLATLDTGIPGAFVIPT